MLFDLGAEQPVSKLTGLAGMGATLDDRDGVRDDDGGCVGGHGLATTDQLHARRDHAHRLALVEQTERVIGIGQSPLHGAFADQFGAQAVAVDFTQALGPQVGVPGLHGVAAKRGPQGAVMGKGGAEERLGHRAFGRVARGIGV